MGICRILVANAKGGCGKTSCATTLASALARTGARVALADATPERSALTWAAIRPATAAPIQALDWTRSLDGAEAAGDDVDWLIVDAPSNLPPARLDGLVARSDVLVAPLTPGVFDVHATQRFLMQAENAAAAGGGHHELLVAGMRMRAKARALARCRRLLERFGIHPIVEIREAALVGELTEAGLSVFDRESARARRAQEEWRPLLHRLAAIAEPRRSILRVSAA